MRKRSSLAKGLGWAADLIWPPRSLLSERIVSRPGAIEPELWSQPEFLSAPCCFRCGFPFELDAGLDAVCGACAAEEPAYYRARAALAYDDQSRSLVLDLKRSGRRDGLPVFAAWMNQAAQPLIAEADFIGIRYIRPDFIAPAPLHWMRLASRRFNQAAWLVQALGALSGKRVLYGAPKWVKRRRSQGGWTLARGDGRSPAPSALRRDRPS